MRSHTSHESYLLPHWPRRALRTLGFMAMLTTGASSCIGSIEPSRPVVPIEAPPPPTEAEKLDAEFDTLMNNLATGVVAIAQQGTSVDKEVTIGPDDDSYLPSEVTITKHYPPTGPDSLNVFKAKLVATPEAMWPNHFVSANITMVSLAGFVGELDSNNQQTCIFYRSPRDRTGHFSGQVSLATNQETTLNMTNQEAGNSIELLQNGPFTAPGLNHAATECYALLKPLSSAA